MVKRISLAIVVLVLFQSRAWSADLYCAAGNVGCLIAAIHISNQNGEDNTIFLEPGIYTLQTMDNESDGRNGLPVISGRVSIRGPEDMGSLIQRGPDAAGFRIFAVAAGGSLSLDWIALQNGIITSASGSGLLGGGAILNQGYLSLNRVSMSGNMAVLAYGGGAIYSKGTLVIRQSDITNNMAGAAAGGGIVAEGAITIEDTIFYKNVTGDNGGALLLSNSVATILRTTFSNNFGNNGTIANYGSLFIESSSIHHNQGFEVGGITNPGSLTIVSSTISDNAGGAINSSGNLSLTNVTVVGNSAPQFNPVAAINNSGTARIQNSILAMNYRDCNRFNSLGNNLIGNLTGCAVPLRPSDRAGDPGLMPFEEDVYTPGSGNHPLLPASPAVDSGSMGACTTADQIGNRRSGKCDIGAVELRNAGRVTAGSLLGLIRP